VGGRIQYQSCRRDVHLGVHISAWPLSQAVHACFLSTLAPVDMVVCQYKHQVEAHSGINPHEGLKRAFLIVLEFHG
jgi:hypothetical protein